MRQTSSKRSHRFLSTWHGVTLGADVLQGDRKLDSNQAILTSNIKYFQLIETKHICAERACSREVLWRKSFCNLLPGPGHDKYQSPKTSICCFYTYTPNSVANLVCAGLPPHWPRCAHTPGRSARCATRAGDVYAPRLESHGCAHSPNRRLQNVCDAAG